MSEDEFGVLAPPSSEGFLATRNQKEIHTETVVCPINPGHQRGGKRLGSLSVVLPQKHETDFIWTWHNDCLISPQALSILMKPIDRFRNKAGGNSVQDAGSRDA